MIFCSAGPDSTCLVYNVYNLQHKKIIKSPITLFHINFHLRSKDSDRDQQFVENLSNSLNFNYFTICTWPRFNAQTTNSKQLWAREIIHHYIEYFTKRNCIVVLGHHFDDLIETILFRLARGSNPWNLKGLSRWKNNVFRPLLDITKNQILEYNHRNNIDFCHDHSNDDLSPSRNRIRHQTLPSLNLINQSYQLQLLNLADQSLEIANYLKSTFNTKISQHNQSIEITDLTNLTPTVLQLVLEQLSNSKLTLTSKQIKEFSLILKSIIDKTKNDKTKNPVRSLATTNGVFYIFQSKVCYLPISKLKYGIHKPKYSLLPPKLKNKLFCHQDITIRIIAGIKYTLRLTNHHCRLALSLKYLDNDNNKSSKNSIAKKKTAIISMIDGSKLDDPNTKAFLSALIKDHCLGFDLRLITIVIIDKQPSFGLFKDQIFSLNYPLDKRTSDQHLKLSCKKTESIKLVHYFDKNCHCNYLILTLSNDKH